MEHILHPGRGRNTLIAVGTMVAASVAGQFATFPNLAPWYEGLAMPSFNPPNGLFGPVWTTLYILMAIAVWRILQMNPATPGRRAALIAFFLQLALNAAWSWMFFAAHSPVLGLINIFPQLGVILASIILFFRLDRLAALCLVPLAAWVSFASLLNVAIWRLNG